MHGYVARANVDHYVGILNESSLTAQHRSTTTGLLVAELDKLSEGTEHLEFAESKVADSRRQVARAASARDSTSLGTTERHLAEKNLVQLENLHTVLDDFCHRLRNKIGSRSP